MYSSKHTLKIYTFIAYKLYLDEEQVYFIGFLCEGIFLSALHDLTLLSQNRRRIYVYLHFTNGKTEAQSGYINI